MWTIRPIKLGELEVDQSALTALRDPGTSVRIPCIAWAVSDSGGDTIVVDAGPPEPALVLERKGRVLYREPEEDPRTAFRSAGIDPLLVTDVAISHLHWDHIGNLELFPNARLWVQRAELAYAIAPLPLHTPPYEALDGRLMPIWLDHLPRMVALDREHELRPGITLHPLPGHTPGLQGVLVETTNGTHMIASDAVPTFRNWDLRVPSATYTDLRAYEATFSSIDRLADFVLPSHDLSVFGHETYPA